MYNKERSKYFEQIMRMNCAALGIDVPTNANYHQLSDALDAYIRHTGLYIL